MYNYWAYGLSVKSEIEFPELLSLLSDYEADIEIMLGEMPDLLLATMKERKLSRIITSSEFLLVVQGVGSYYVGVGRTIVIKKDPEADWDSVRLFCLSNAFAAILYQRKSIPLHCAAFEFKNQLVLIFGDSGAGKSSTLGAMQKRGFKVFSDDVCVPVINEVSGRVSLYSSYPMLKYWKKTIQQLGIDPMRISRRIRPDMEKYGIYFHDQFSIETREPILNFVLNVSSNRDSIMIKPITGIELFTQLEHNAYRGEQLGYADLKKEHFTLFTCLANQCSSFMIQRPKETDSLDDVADLIEEQLMNTEKKY